ncbi:hypothetical protein N7465_010727 [Penicillium sp. CMV-2018d]|nr:hypothetical protein N7465_010727 [Penicillium sp. CMV-2018d]
MSSPVGINSTWGGTSRKSSSQQFSPWHFIIIGLLNLFNFYIPLEKISIRVLVVPGLTSYFHFRLRTLQTNSAFDAIILRFLKFTC